MGKTFEELYPELATASVISNTNSKKSLELNKKNFIFETSEKNMMDTYKKMPVNGNIAVLKI